jgi:hypothetical protein
LGWSIGKTDGALNRMLRKKKIIIKEIERDGRKVKLIYPHSEIISEIISIPEDKLKLGNPAWQNNAYFYSLDSETIGISGKEFDPWSKISRFKSINKIKHINSEIKIELPKEFKDFYKLKDKHYSISINSNNILLVIMGKIIS